MWKLLWKILKSGTLTESYWPKQETTSPSEYRRSASIRHLDSGSCNGCELELWALENPVHSLSSQGFSFVASPRHADILLVTGPLSCHMKEALEKTYQAMPSPKRLLAVGDCAINGGVFRGSYAIHNGVTEVMSPNLTVPGCPPRPEEIADAIRRSFSPAKTHSDSPVLDLEIRSPLP